MALSLNDIKKKKIPKKKTSKVAKQPVMPWQSSSEQKTTNKEETVKKISTRLSNLRMDEIEANTVYIALKKDIESLPTPPPAEQIDTTIMLAFEEMSSEEIVDKFNLKKIVPDPVRDSVRDVERDSVRDVERDPVRDVERDSVRDVECDPVRDVERDSIRDVEHDVERDSIRDSIRDSVRDVERDSVRDSVRDVERDPVRDVERDSVRDSVRDVERDSVRDVERDSVRDVERDSVRDVERDSKSYKTLIRKVNLLVSEHNKKSIKKKKLLLIICRHILDDINRVGDVYISRDIYNKEISRKLRIENGTLSKHFRELRNEEIFLPQQKGDSSKFGYQIVRMNEIVLCQTIDQTPSLKKYISEKNIDFDFRKKLRGLQ